MSQEWFPTDKPFYLVQIFYAGKDDEGPKARMFLFENRITVGTVIRNSHSDCDIVVVRFSSLRVTTTLAGDAFTGTVLWEGRAGDFRKDNL